MKNYHIQIIKGENLSFSSSSGFRFVAYLLNMICLSYQIYIYKFWYNFDTVLYQFLETGTSDRTIIGLETGTSDRTIIGLETGTSDRTIIGLD